MIVTALPTNANKQSLSLILPDASEVIEMAKTEGLWKNGVMSGWPIMAVTRPKSFHDNLMQAMKLAVANDPSVDFDVLFTLSEADGMIAACYAAAEHVDTDVSDYGERWVVVIQATPGYRFKGYDAQGRFDLPLVAGQVIAFNEREPHEVIAESPEAIDIDTPNLFYTMPDPTASVEMAMAVGLL